MRDIQVRPARPEDMERAGMIMARSFCSAFADFISQETLDACAREENCALLLADVLREGNMQILMGGDDGILVWQREEMGAQIVAIHSLPESWGSGLGAAMLNAALAQIGPEPVYLWAFAKNSRARRFYEKHGFSWDGSSRVSEFDGAEEVRYVKNP